MFPDVLQTELGQVVSYVDFHYSPAADELDQCPEQPRGRAHRQTSGWLPTENDPVDRDVVRPEQPTATRSANAPAAGLRDRQ